ncbi:hypothetical protein ABMA70_03075 [Halobacteriovorax sp. XZX-3]
MDKLVTVFFYVPLLVTLMWVIGFVLYKLGLYKPKIESDEKKPSGKGKAVILVCLLALIGFSGYYKFACSDACKASIQSYLR